MRGDVRQTGGADADNAARSEHLRLANILDQMPVGIGIFDRLGHLYHSNRHFEGAAGGAIHSLEAMADESWSALCDDGSLLDEKAYPGSRALEGHIATPGVDFRRRMQDGRDHWVSVSAVPLTAQDVTDIVGVVMVVENAEAKRKSLERLKATEERFRRFAQYSSNALWIADLATGRMDYLSPAAANIWRSLGDVPTLAKLAAIIHPEDAAGVARHRRAVAAGQVRRFGYRIANDRGEVLRQVRETSFLIPGELGSEDCVGGIVEDISPDMQIYLIGPRESQAQLLDGVRLPPHRVKSFAGKDDLIRVADVLNPGCLVVDLRATAPDPAAIAALLADRPADLQIVLIGPQDTPVGTIVAAMRNGAADYLLEPVDPGTLELAILNAFDALHARFDPPTQLPEDAAATLDADVTARFGALPKREREVLDGLLAGHTNKMIARELGISPRTVEVHRAHLMERLNVRSLSELLRRAHRRD